MRWIAGVKLGRVFGIEIDVDWSLLIIFGLIMLLLARGVFPSWHPHWSAGTAWGTAFAASVLFFLSILLHELSHALVGRKVGVSIRKITLFMFGGMAQMENEPPSWRSELGMALVGPLTSLILGGIFLAFGAFAVGKPIDVVDTEKAFSQIGPLPTLLLWLGPVNIVLGIFNLVPGFPLDGGRALRAVMWAVTGDIVVATRWASRGGQAFAWLMMAVGLAMIFGARLPYLGGGFINGLWLAFIGWFLNNAALASYRQLLVRESLERVPVSRLMQTRLVSIPPEMPIGKLVDEVLIASGQRAFPVERDGEFLGMVFVSDLHRLHRDDWSETPVSRVMVAAASIITVQPDRDAMEALAVLGGHKINQVPVMEDGRLLGLLRREDVLSWLALHTGRRHQRRQA